MPRAYHANINDESEQTGVDNSWVQSLGLIKYFFWERNALKKIKLKTKQVLKEAKKWSNKKANFR